MIEFSNYISDALIKCKIVRGETGKIDLFAIFCNDKVEGITGFRPEALVNQNMAILFPKLSDSLFDWPRILSEAAMTNEHKIIEQYFPNFERYLRLSVFGYKDDTFYIAAQDVTEKKEIRRIVLEKDRQIQHLENEIKSRANVDMLTRLYNFQFMIDCINNSIASYKEEGANFCMLIIDIDDFKTFNLSYGMNTGDKVLQDFARILSSVVRKIDVAGRYENDKFIVVMNNVDIDIAKLMVEKVKMETKNYNLNINNTSLSTCGALVEYNGETIEELFSKAEALLVKAQSMGKGIILS
ncbi:sensor domain-containing diguanylate cyclase [Sedimentibacter saalensis]|uniref:Diguanylate cyclase (GGDEF)-like protein n=1 Tax=Sedimentibacter saalensis TaxID=130788 RepID=A0A562JKD2_9FIRM|nr:diguanylate cyclase [Sedimentibacter saalensis]TWH83707.1 diguanylate cyclase (GGDEF)-like protein [Sedimentibacter saalensis]